MPSPIAPSHAAAPVRILLVGKLGQVGWELRRTLAPLGTVAAIDFPEIDLSNAESTSSAVRKARPQVIVNAAAYTSVDQAETEPDLCRRINALGPAILAEEAKRAGALLVHFSTDYVFDGMKNTPYTEDDQPNPWGAYGRAKLFGDQAIQQSGCDHLIFRLCWVYGIRGRNFLLTILRLAREKEELRVVADQFGCPSWSRLIAEASTLALNKVLSSPDRGCFSGIYNLASSGHTNWHDFASRIVKLMPHDQVKCRAVQPIPTSEYPLPARRPAYSVLSCEKLKRVFGLQLPSWDETLALVFQDLK
jgi:dTDP-4-dehydrorhamnose reductase